MGKGATPALPRLSVLVLADYTSDHATTVIEHISALRELSRHDIRLFNPRELHRSRFLDLDEFDVVVVHYSLVAISDGYLAPPFRDALRRFDGLKVQMIQDDYRWVDDFTANIADLGITVLFTLVPERELDAVWKPEKLPGVERITTLAGYAPHESRPRPAIPLAERPYDIVYRGRALPYWLGRLGQEKAWIAQGVLQRAEASGLVVDVDWRENARIYGRDWEAFLGSGRATLGSESGASITDFDGTLQKRVEAYVAERPGATYAEVHDAILSPYEGNVMMNVVSPRVFETIAARTALVMFPGEYSGAVQPNAHFIPLAKDFSNWEEVVERLHDLDGLQVMVDRAYEEVIASGRFAIDRFVERFDRALDEHGRVRSRSDVKRGHRAAVRERPVRLKAQRVAFRLRVARHYVLVAAYTLLSILALGRAFDAPLKIALALSFVRHDRDLRALVSAWRAGRRAKDGSAAGAVALLDDVLKLGVLRRLVAGDWPEVAEGGGVVVEREVRDGALTLRTTYRDQAPGASGGLAPVPHSMAEGPPTRLVWDHRRIGTCVPWKPGRLPARRIAVGTTGVHEFAAVNALAAREPRIVEQLANAVASGA